MDNQLLENDIDEEEEEYINTLEYEQSKNMIKKHYKFITYKTIKNLKKNTFIKQIYEYKNYDTYLNIEKYLSNKMQKNLIIEINEYLDCKEKIRMILLPEFIFKNQLSPFKDDNILLNINDKDKKDITEDDIKYINNLLLKRIIFNLYMYKFYKRIYNIKKKFYI